MWFKKTVLGSQGLPHFPRVLLDSVCFLDFLPHISWCFFVLVSTTQMLVAIFSTDPGWRSQPAHRTCTCTTCSAFGALSSEKILKPNVHYANSCPFQGMARIWYLSSVETCLEAWEILPIHLLGQTLSKSSTRKIQIRVEDKPNFMANKIP